MNLVNLTVPRAFYAIPLAVSLVLGCDDATDPTGRDATLRPGVYALVTVNGAPVPTATPDGDHPARELPRRLRGSELTLEPIVASRTLTGVVERDTVRLAVGNPGAPITNIYVRR